MTASLPARTYALIAEQKDFVLDSPREYFRPSNLLRCETIHGNAVIHQAAGVVDMSPIGQRSAWKVYETPASTFFSTSMQPISTCLIQSCISSSQPDARFVCRPICKTSAAPRRQRLP